MKQHISSDDLLNFDQRYRATFINSLGGFKSLALIGTRSPSGQTNLAVFNSVFHLGANLPLFGLVVRPDSVERHTLSAILSTKQFTVNHVSEHIFKQAHQTSARYPNTTSEFEACGLTPEYLESTYPPFVKESPIQIGAELVRKIDVVENGTILLIAQINLVRVPKNCMGPDGFVDLEKAGTITCSGLDTYHKTQKLARLAYAKPGLPTTTLD
jgi:flavin reductase (DIM6/NTAB) family NADH-FMN oxidoreductase RutF